MRRVLVWAEWWKGCQVFMCILALVGLLLVEFQWPLTTWLRMSDLEVQDGATEGVAWPFFRPSFRSIEAIKVAP